MSGVYYVVLCEDQDHRRFAEHFLKAHGVHPRSIRTTVAPAGAGAASAWVLRRYPAELSEFRRQQAKRSVALLIIVDGDGQQVAARLRQLDQSARENKIATREQGEAVAVWIPQRNIETWVYQLLGNDANETNDYCNRVEAKNFKTAALEFRAQFLNHRHEQSAKEALLPAMRAAMEECRRIL